MAETVDHIVLEQSRLIREDIAKVERTLSDKTDDLELKANGHTAILIGVGRYIHDMDERVEHIEEKLGIDT